VQELTKNNCFVKLFSNQIFLAILLIILLSLWRNTTSMSILWLFWRKHNFRLKFMLDWG